MPALILGQFFLEGRHGGVLKTIANPVEKAAVWVDARGGMNR